MMAMLNRIFVFIGLSCFSGLWFGGELEEMAFADGDGDGGGERRSLFPLPKTMTCGRRNHQHAPATTPASWINTAPHSKNFVFIHCRPRQPFAMA